AAPCATANVPSTTMATAPTWRVQAGNRARIPRPIIALIPRSRSPPDTSRRGRSACESRLRPEGACAPMISRIRALATWRDAACRYFLRGTRDAPGSPWRGFRALVPTIAGKNGAGRLGVVVAGRAGRAADHRQETRLPAAAVAFRLGDRAGAV